jgi:hypothetical protein
MFHGWRGFSLMGFPKEEDFSTAKRFQSHDGSHQFGLPIPRHTDNGKDLSSSDGERDVMEG